MNIYEVAFEPLYPVPHGFVLMAGNKNQALVFAMEYLLDKGMSVENVSVTQMDFGAMKITGLDKPQVIFFESGDY
ncbi:hypothetical protein [Psychrobacter sp. K31L]|uniref:hypothetical protein n=1 Tax=Psychrobacter sp. K31L TaxID=2820758 RepID=UPI001B33FA48|nr:hypothetical protein [Psychrobacter sp. K31L]MBP3945164.1 hypothetical protein [Psychrobacter sp. K31L]